MSSERMKLFEVRKSLGMKRGEFARALGVSAELVARIELGYREPTAAIWSRVRALLDRERRGNRWAGQVRLRKGRTHV